MIDRLWPFALAGTILVADRVSKYFIETRVQMWEIHPVIPGFLQIIHTRNRGIAFGIFNDSSQDKASILLVIFSLAVLAFVARLLWKHSQMLEGEHWTLRLGLGLVLGGAMGNVYDRAVLGSVTDFLDFYWGSAHFPAFNVADSAITVGAAFLLINLWLSREAPREAAKP